MANLIATGGYSIKNVFDGDPAKSYRIQLDNTAIIKDNLTQSVTPDGLTVASLEISGFSDPVAFLGYFKIYRRSDAGITMQDYEQLLAEGKIVPESTYIIGQTSNLLVEVYRSTQAESSVIYDVEYASDTTGIYVCLYKDASFQTLLDLATVPVSPNGVKVKTITIEYKMDDQGVTPPTAGWATTIPAPVPGKYLWTRATTLFDDGKESIAYSVSGHGATGIDARAVQLSASTTVIAYDALGSNPSLATLPLTAASVNTAGTPYYEFLVNGSSKQNGTGSSYTYAVPSTYSGATATIEVRLREGGTTGTVLAKDLLTVTQIKPGQDAYTVVLSNESHTFPGTETAAIAGSTSTKIIAFKGVTQVPVTINTITGHPTGMTTSIANNNSIDARVDITVTTGLVALGGELVVPVTVDGKAFEKKFTFSVARKGNDGYMVALTNEAHVFGGDVNGATGETISTQVMAYRGGTQLPVKFGTITAPTGMTITKVGDDTTNASLTIAVTSGLTPLKGTITIPMTIDSKSMSKTFSYSTALKGADGRAITAVDVEFASSTSNSTAPASGWATSAPTWQQGYYIWSRTKTTYSTGSPTYSAATCISGSTGSTGIGISLVKEQYNLSTSNVEANGSWVDTMPNFVSGSFIWTRMQITWTDASVTNTSPVLANAINDANQKAIDVETQTQLKAPFIIGTQTASTSAWTGVAPFASLVSGQQITYLLPQASTGTSVTLNLTLAGGGTTGALNAYYGGTSRLTTHYGQGNVIRLTYLVDNLISGTKYTGWWADANYDSNSFDRVQYARNITAKTAITSGWLIGSDASGYFKLAAGTTIMTDRPILYAASAIAAGASGSNNYTVYSALSLSSTFTVTGYVANDVVYLKGQLDGLNFTLDATSPITKTPVDDGSEYMLLGQMYSTTSISLYGTHDLYTFHNGSFKSFAQIAAETSALVKTVVSSADQEYAVLNSASDSTGATWKTTADIPAAGQFLWSRTKLTLVDGTVTYKPSSAGTNISGAQGADGRSITSVVEEYNLSTSSTTANGTWVSTSPTWEDGKYIWTRTTVNYSSGSPSVFGPTNITGAKGSTGSAGADAYSINLSKESYVFAGGTTNAIDGQSTTIDITALKGIAAANVTIGSITGAPTGMTTSISGSGTAKATVTVSVASSMTSVSGSLVIPVTVDGKSFTRNFTYGLALKGTTGSTGAAGSDGVAVLMSNESHVFAGNTAGADVGSVASNIVAYKGGTLIPVTVGSITTPTGLSVSVSGNGGTAVSLTISVTTGLTPLAGTVTIPLTVDGKSFTKIFSYSTSLKGTNGSNGQDAVSINLSKESYIFPGSTSAALTSNTSFTVSALKGGTAIPVTVTSSGTPTGMTATITGSETDTATVTVEVTTAMNTVSGSFTLTITADSKTFTRSFAYAIALTGDDGLPGPAGTSSYTHIAYATNATGTTGFSLMDSVGKTYIGMYVDNILADSDDPTKYKWTLIKGADGAQGVQGPAGSNGLTPYFHVAYATNATGTAGFSKTDPTARPYMGTYSDYVAADSDNPADYTWSLIQGPAGTPATPLYTWVRYADTPTSGMSADSTNKKYMGIATNKTSQTPSSNYADYTWTLLFDQSVIGTNLLVRNGEWENQLLDADGAMLGTDNICVSAVDIDVIEGQVYTFTKRTTTLDLDGGYWRVATYNASGDFVSRWITSSNEYQWIVPTGIKTIRASYPIDCFPKIEKGPRGTEWIPASGDVDKKIYEAITAMGAQIDNTQASILQTVYETYVNKSTLSEYQTQVASAISQTADQVAIKFSEATSQINSVDGKLVEKFTTMENHITFDAVDGSINLRAFSSDPSINTDISLKILRDKITFYQGDKPVAYFSENKLYITNGEFLNSLRLGNFAFTPRTNGNLSFGKVV